MDDPIAQAMLRAIHMLTKDDYGETDGAAIVAELVREGVGLPNQRALGNLIRRLKQDGYIQGYLTAGFGIERAIHVQLTPSGRAALKEADPFEQVVTEARRSISSDGFAAAYPGAFEPWADAERLLCGDNAEAELTTIGHKVREATQAFATALVQNHRPPHVDSNPANVEKRLGAVIEMHRELLPEAHRLALEALGNLWKAANKLIQRQEHGAQKEREPVTWDDARRIVYLTMFLMIEFVTIIDERPKPDRVAFLEPG